MKEMNNQKKHEKTVKIPSVPVKKNTGAPAKKKPLPKGPSANQKKRSPAVLAVSESLKKILETKTSTAKKGSVKRAKSAANQNPGQKSPRQPLDPAARKEKAAETFRPDGVFVRLRSVSTVSLGRVRFPPVCSALSARVNRRIALNKSNTRLARRRKPRLPSVES